MMHAGATDSWLEEAEPMVDRPMYDPATEAEAVLSVPASLASQSSDTSKRSWVSNSQETRASPGGVSRGKVLFKQISDLVLHNVYHVQVLSGISAPSFKTSLSLQGASLHKVQPGATAKQLPHREAEFQGTFARKVST